MYVIGFDMSCKQSSLNLIECIKIIAATIFNRENIESQHIYFSCQLRLENCVFYSR